MSRSPEEEKILREKILREAAEEDRLAQLEKQRLIRQELTPARVRNADLGAMTGYYPQKYCKNCGEPLNNSYKGRLCSRCYFKFKRAREKKRRYY